MRRLLERREARAPVVQEPTSAAAPSGWIGNLHHLAVEELLQLLEVGRRSATVTIDAGGKRGQVGVKSGALVFARLEALEGVDALDGMIGAASGIFRVSFSAPEEENLSGNTTALLLDALRRADEADR